jgi:hypothetical protein
MSQERLSVELAREHVENGHKGKYAHYCYRCQWFDEYEERAGWELLAIEKSRVWLYPKGSWWGGIGFGSDEYCRRTFYVGRLVMALWRARDKETREYVEHLRKRSTANEGQRDRDGQPGRYEDETGEQS